jgi:hypothetical protein
LVLWEGEGGREGGVVILGVVVVEEGWVGRFSLESVVVEKGGREG